MRVLPGLLAFLACAAAHAAGMGAEDARHLLNRVGFDARIVEIDAYARLGRREAVERLLSDVRTTARTPVPAAAAEWDSPMRLCSLLEEERRRVMQKWREDSLVLRGWWLGEMLATDSPLTERMTLFWHNHFATSVQKVRSNALMQRQNELLRRHALGSLRDLLHAVAKDPAMLVYLDTARSRRGQPNENFAREVMELFTLGEGRYSERDVKEAARAFTGWSIEPETGAFLFRPGMHDGGEKTVLERTGNWRGEDILDILLARPETAEFITRKLWVEFVSPTPQGERDRRDLARVAAQFRNGGYAIRTALRELLLSDSFWAPENRATLVKSPADLVVGTLRQFNVEVSDPLPFALLMRNLGQDLFAPPNVKGWPGGESWITAQTLLARKQFLERILRVDESRMSPGLVTDERMKEMKGPARRVVQTMLDLRFSADEWLRPYAGRQMPHSAQLVLLAAPPHGEPAKAGGGIALVRAIVSDPVYQLR